MEKSRLRALAWLLLLGGILVWAGSYGWSHRVQEFRGVLRYDPNIIGIPECPPPVAFLATTSRGYPLGLPKRGQGGLSPSWRDELTRLAGKEVMVRGRLRTWRMGIARDCYVTGIRVIEIKPVDGNFP